MNIQSHMIYILIFIWIKRKKILPFLPKYVLIQFGRINQCSYWTNQGIDDLNFIYLLFKACRTDEKEEPQVQVEKF